MVDYIKLFWLLPILLTFFITCLPGIVMSGSAKEWMDESCNEAEIGKLQKESSCPPILRAETYEESLNKIRLEYRALPNTPDVKRLVELDQEIRAIVREIKETRNGIITLSESYRDIGLFFGHYSEELEYSGKLLREAHNRNPKSSYRKYTLFATTFGDDNNLSGSGDIIKQAELYLKEFPNGPFAENAHTILGYFYDDLSKILRDFVENKKCTYDYKCGCFESYVTKEPYKKQMKRAIKLAVEHLEKAIAINPASKENTEKREILEMVRDGGGSNVWHSCSD